MAVAILTVCKLQVLAKRQATPLANRILQPKLNLGSKAVQNAASAELGFKAECAGAARLRFQLWEVIAGKLT